VVRLCHETEKPLQCAIAFCRSVKSATTVKDIFGIVEVGHDELGGVTTGEET